jgi:hypothetical protein
MNSNHQRLGLLFPLVFGGIGSVMLVVAGIVYYYEQAFLAKAVLVRGEVIGLELGRGSFFPIVGYTTEEDQTIRFTASFGSNPPPYRKGDAVDVYYDPEMPENAKLGGFFSQWLMVLIFGGLGVLFTAIAIGSFLLIRKPSTECRLA